MSDIFVFICTRSTYDIAVPAQSRDLDDFSRKVSGALGQLNGGYLRVGDLKLRPTSEPIDHHLLCDGTAVVRTQFPQLFALLGTSQGNGDGTTTFALPNYLGDNLTVAPSAPAQVISEGGTVSTAAQVITPPTGVGHSQGGNVLTGGRRQRLQR